VANLDKVDEAEFEKKSGVGVVTTPE